METDIKPPDVLGKGWYWVDVITNTDPVITPDEALGSVDISITNNTVIETRQKIEIPATKGNINEIREGLLSKKYSFDILGPLTITSRCNANSLTYLQGFVTTILNDKISNNQGSTYTFRDEDNINYELSCEQMLDLFDKINEKSEKIFKASWLIKDDIAKMPVTLKDLKQDIRWP